MKRRGSVSLLFPLWLRQAGNEDALAQQMWGWLMVKGCREWLQRATEERWVGCCGGLETPLQAFTAEQECLCSLACLVWSDNKALFQYWTLMYNSMQEVWAKLTEIKPEPAGFSAADSFSVLLLNPGIIMHLFKDISEIVLFNKCPSYAAFPTITCSKWATIVPVNMASRVWGPLLARLQHPVDLAR